MNPLALLERLPLRRKLILGPAVLLVLFLVPDRKSVV